MKFTLEDVRSRTYKARDAWWTVFLVDPLAGRLVVAVANRTSITPNQITWGAFLLGLGSAGCFLTADPIWLAAGAVLYHLSFVLDCMDGKIARLKGTGTVLGGWLDYVFDRIRVFGCALALTWGQYQSTGQDLYLLLGIGIVFLDMLRYVDALQVTKVRRQMRRTIRMAYEAAAPAGSRSPARSLLHDDPDLDLDTNSDFDADSDSHEDHVRTAEAVDLQVEFHSRYAWYIPFRAWLRAHRVRTHLVSGIEFQMAVFIIGPLLGALSSALIIAVTIGAAIPLLAFEAAIMYKLWLSSRDFTRALAEIRETRPPHMAGA
ncbi:CDP-alcohol phosphatidyltransferase family protein [Sphaerimonospora cavernae]|uniref:CDP-alcohol phosphatidyltransferase family protein n=1 Tax=Sphaerimonospora cavernae TaxID=1740611 RepID=A0ABV6UDT2_9ACTN